MPQALVFYTSSVTKAEMAQVLAEFGMIGEVYQKDSYLAGKNFFSGLTFLGCSPQLRLTPEEGLSFCYLELFDSPRWFAGSNSKPPRCPACSQVVEDWHHVRESFAQLPACARCQQDLRLDAWQGGKNIAYAQAGFLVWDVFENEAVPSQALLQALQALSPDWQTLFYRA